MPHHDADHLATLEEETTAIRRAVLEELAAGLEEE